MSDRPLRYLAWGGLVFYCIAALYLLSGVIDRPFFSSRAAIDSNLKTMRGVDVGAYLTVHVLDGDVFSYDDTIPNAYLASYTPFIPVLARYRIPQQAKIKVKKLVLENDLDVQALLTIGRELPVTHGMLNGLTLRIEDRVLRKAIWLDYLTDPKITEDSAGFGGQILYFNPSDTDLRREPLFFKNRISSVAFLTFDDLVGLDKDSYINVATDNYSSGLEVIVDKMRRFGVSGTAPKSILLTSLNTPLIKYGWVGEAQALAIRELDRRIASSEKVPFGKMREYAPGRGTSGRANIFLVPFVGDKEVDRDDFVAGIREGMLKWTNPIYSTLLLAAVPIVAVMGFLLSGKIQYPRIALLMYGALFVIAPVAAAFKELMPVQIVLVCSSFLAGKLLKDELDKARAVKPTVDVDLRDV